MSIWRTPESRIFLILIVLSSACAIANPLLDVVHVTGRQPRVVLSILQAVFLALSLAFYIAARRRQRR